jgi:hypothetical protein
VQDHINGLTPGRVDGGKTFSATAYDNAGNDASDSAVIKLSKSTSTTVSTSLPVSVNKVLILNR